MAELGYLNYPFANLVPGWQMAVLGYVNYPFSKLSLLPGWQSCFMYTILLPS